MGIVHDHENCGHRRRALRRLGDIEFEGPRLPPALDRCLSRTGQELVATEGVFQAFFEQHVEGLAQPEQQVHRRRAAVLHVVEFALSRGPVPIARPQPGIGMGGERGRTCPDEAQARRHHEPLLRTGHSDIDTPAVHLEGHRAERRDDIDHEERTVTARIDGLAQCRDVVHDAGSRVHLNDQDGLEIACAIGTKACFQRLG